MDDCHSRLIASENEAITALLHLTREAGKWRLLVWGVRGVNQTRLPFVKNTEHFTASQVRES
jgi:hypothetical protein